MAPYRSGEQLSSKENLAGTLGCGITALILVLICLRVCTPGGGGGGPVTAGNVAALVSTAADAVLVARTRDDLARLAELAAVDDSIGISHMRLAGRVWMVPSGTKRPFREGILLDRF